MHLSRSYLPIHSCPLCAARPPPPPCSPNGGSLSGSYCDQSYSATVNHDCPSGYSYSASTGKCSKDFCSTAWDGSA